MKTCFILALAVFAPLALVAPAIAQQQPAAEQEVSDEALREMIYKYGEGVGGADGYKSIAAHGVRAQDAIFEVLSQLRPVTGGRTPPGATPSVRYESVDDPDRVLWILANVDAPLPIDRLCEFIEHGPNFECQFVALWLLAGSGHPKGLAYIEYVRDCAAKSFHPDDRSFVSRLNDCTKAWEINNLYIRTGEVALGQKVAYRQISLALPATTQIAYKPSVATDAMRRAYQKDPGILAWEGAIDEAYLGKRLPEVLPLIGDKTANNGDYAILGRFYEPVLAPLLLDWHKGRTQPLESLIGHPLIDPKRANTRMKENMLAAFVSMMSGDIALGIKKELIFGSKATSGRDPVLRDYSLILLRHDPEKWVEELISHGVAASERPEIRAFVILKGLNDLKRPLTENERAQIPALLAQPRMDITSSCDWLRGDEDAGLRCLARSEPQAFRDALHTQHLSPAVVDAIIMGKLYNDKNVVFERIEYAMLHDRDRQSSVAAPVSPEELKARLEKMPPDVRARAEARMNNPRPAAPERVRINNDWFDLIDKDMRDDPDALKFLQSLATKKEFEGCGMGRYIDEMLRIHPEWK